MFAKFKNEYDDDLYINIDRIIAVKLGMQRNTVMVYTGFDKIIIKGEHEEIINIIKETERWIKFIWFLRLLVIAIQVWEADSDGQPCEPYTRLTVNLGEKLPSYVAYYVNYPKYVFDVSKLK